MLSKQNDVTQVQKDIVSVKYLLSIGANKNAKDKVGKTPFDIVDNEEIRAPQLMRHSTE